MGKRRKPVRKPNYQSLDDVKLEGMRMASDEMRYLTEEIPDRELGPAYERLLDITDKMNQRDQQFIDAGVPASEFQGFQQLQVPMLKNGVPAPYIDKSVPGLERRVHTQHMENPKTGGTEVTIIPNKGQEGRALVTELGHNVNMEGEDKASEYIQDHVLRLMGDNPVRGPKGKVDFYVERDGKRIGIDGQTSRVGWNPSVQAYAKVIPRKRDRGEYGYGYSRDGRNSIENERAIVNDISMMLEREMGGGTGLKRAVNNLIQDGSIEKDEWLRGKAYRDNYDEVIMPVVNAKDHYENRVNDLQAIAPDKVVGYSMADVRDRVDNISDPSKLKIAHNAGWSRRDEARGQISVDVPRGAIKDQVKVHPYVAQILRNLPYA